MAHDRKKILHVTASLDQGGAETVLFNLVRGLQPYYDQKVISFRDGYFKQPLNACGVPVHILSAHFALRVGALYRLLRNDRPALIHSLLWSSNLFTRLCALGTKTPVVCAVHSPFNTNTGNSWLRTCIDCLTAQLATKTVFVSPTVRAAAPIATCVPSRKQVLIYNGILCDELYARAHAQQKMRSQLGFTEQDFIIGMVGRLVPVKNQQLLIMLVEQLRHVYPQLRLLILGHGPLLQEYNNYIQIHNLREHVRIIHDTALGYYRLFDCFVLPSKTEGLSIALLEAMSFKLPVVVARTAGVCGVIEHGSNGLIFDTENLAELARCIQSLMAEPQLRVTLGEGALKTVQMRFAIDAMLAAYRNLFDTLSIDNLPG